MFSANLTQLEILYFKLCIFLFEIGNIDQSKLQLFLKMRKQEYICKNPHLFVINLFCLESVQKARKKLKKKKNRDIEICVFL